MTETKVEIPEHICSIVERWKRRGEEEMARLTSEERAARDREIQEDEQRERLEVYTRRCLRIVPPKYRLAEVTQPAVETWMTQGKPGLLLTGNVGVGKTSECFGVIKRYLIDRVDVVYEPAPKMFWKLQPGHVEDDSGYMNTLQTCGLLVIDDLGANKTTEAREDALWLVLDERYRWERRTVLATNFPPGKFTERFGERLASRLAEMCDVVPMTGPDRRRVPDSEVTV